jgi:fucose 4-O-acetylase-like acetyltransferase
MKNYSDHKLSRNRIEYLDIAKGLLITLVVFGHAWRAVYNNGILLNVDIYHLVDSWIYAFHMPAFFFISGVFAMDSAQRPVKAFISAKVRTIAYPYLLWSVIQSVLQLMMSGNTTSTITVADILKIPFDPVMQFWFLYALFFIFLFFILLHQSTNSPVVYLCVGVALFIMVRTGYAPSYSPVIYLANNFIYFAAGIFFAGYLPTLSRNLTGSVRLLLFLIIAFLMTCFIPSASDNHAPSMNLWLAPLFAVPGIAASLLAALLMQMKATRFTEVFDLLGRRSLEIFVAHTIFSAGFRITIWKLAAINSLSIHLVGATIAGLIGPLLLVNVVKRFKFRYMFFWPSQKS